MIATESVSLADKLRFLSASDAYAFRPASVEVIETHMSYVFLAGARAYKLKKPVRYPFLDFSTLAARERDCREELRLNRRLAPDAYLGVLPLTAEDARLSLGGEGEVVDWIVEMRRLPRERMLDHLIARDGVTDASLDAVCDTLAGFYRGAQRSTITPEAYLSRFLDETRLDRDILTRDDFPHRDEATQLLDRLDSRLASSRPMLEARVREGRVVDGHGDLRPEHVCLNTPVEIFDCLEFNASLRQVDPFDEIALLGVECAQLGAPHLLARFARALAARLDAPAPDALVSLYGAWRAALRARLSFSHLLEPSARTPEKWAPLAQRYLSIGARLLDEETLWLS